MNIQCTQIMLCRMYLVFCNYAGLALILFDESGTQYSLIVPNDDIYRDDCADTANSSCYGAHIVYQNDLGIVLTLLKLGSITDCDSDTIDLDGLLNCMNPVSTCSPSK